MNYIKKQQEKIKIYENGLRELEMYLQSSKFFQDINVNKNDVLLRLDEIKQALVTVEATN